MVKFAVRRCKVCLVECNPTGARQLYCDTCGLKKNKSHSLDWYYSNHDREKGKRNKNSRDRTTNNSLANLLSHARNRASKKNIEFSITKEDLIVPDTCPVFGTPFVPRTRYAMSLDRINPTKGYVVGNVQIISRKANTMKNDATKEELLKFSDWAREFSKLT